MKQESVELPDAYDVAAEKAWAAELREWAATAAQYQARLAQIDAALASPAAQKARNAVDAAQESFSTATTERDQAKDALDIASDAAVAHREGKLRDDRTALDNATLAVSVELGKLMASATTSAALTATIDGLALRARYRAALASDPPMWNLATIPFRLKDGDQAVDSQVDLPVIGTADHAALMQVLGALDNHVDAVADLVTAEGLHQLVSGNLVRSGAALDIAATGTVTDTLDVARTPDPAHDITHRVLLVSTPEPAAAWTGPQTSLVAATDPGYAAWLSSVLPDPATVYLSAAAVTEGNGPDPAHTVDLTAADLQLDPPDWVRVAADKGELLARVAVAALPALEIKLNGPITGRMVLTAPASIPAGGLPLPALLAACAAVKAVMGTARALTSEDLAAGGQTPDPTPAGIKDLAIDRVHAVQASLHELDTDLAAADTLAPAALVPLLLRASAAGIAEATPPTASGPTDLTTLRALALAARRRLASRLAHPPFSASTLSAEATLAAARELLPVLCGAPVPLMLPVTMSLPSAAGADLTQGTVPLPGAKPVSVREWLSDHGRVRPALASMLTLYDVAETIGAEAALQPRVTQLPRGADAAWAGTDPRPQPGLVDILVLNAGSVDLTPQVSGLAVDAWTQSVPADSYGTGVAVHFDEPTADPPQAVLVAVSADVRPEHAPATWDVASLVGAVTATMALAQDRAVAADLVPGAYAMFEEQL